MSTDYGYIPTVEESRKDALELVIKLTWAVIPTVTELMATAAAFAVFIQTGAVVPPETFVPGEDAAARVTA